MKTVIVYHANCHDGLTALWAAKQAYPDAEEYPGQHGSKPELERLKGRDVIVVDFSWKREDMLAVRDASARLTVLDHHVSAEKDLSDPAVSARNGDRIIFDMKRSGAGLAWDYLMGGERPPLVSYVEDRDLWRFALPKSREVHAACSGYPLTMEAREKLLAMSIDKLAAEGEAILRYHNLLIESAIPNAMRETIDGHDVPSIACPTIALCSDLAGRLAVGEKFAAVFTDRPDGSRYYSLRSVPGSGLDVSEIATKLGGGGHKNASGFVRKKG